MLRQRLATAGNPLLKSPVTMDAEWDKRTEGISLFKTTGRKKPNFPPSKCPYTNLKCNLGPICGGEANSPLRLIVMLCCVRLIYSVSESRPAAAGAGAIDTSVIRDLHNYLHIHA